MKKVFKYSLVAFAILLTLWLAALLVVYFVVDVEMIKKSVISSVKQNTDGELELSSIEMKLFPVVHFDAKDIKFISSKRFNKKEMLACKSVSLNFNILSLIFGSPKITLGLDNPIINVIATATTNNIVDVLKKTEPVANEKATEQAAEKIEIPSYLLIASVSFKVNDAVVNFKSPTADLKITDLQIGLEVDPVLRKANVNVSTPFSLKQGAETLKGKLALLADIILESKDKLLLQSSLKLDGLGLPLAINIDARSDFDSLDINKLIISISKEWLKAKGKISNLKAVVPTIDLELETITPLDLSILSAIAPAIKENKVTGTLSASASIKGALVPLPYVKKFALSIDAITIGGGKKGDLSLSLTNNPKYLNSFKAILASNYIELALPASTAVQSKKAETASASDVGKTTNTGKSASGTPEIPVIAKEDIKLIKESIADYSINVNAKLKKVKMDSLVAEDIVAILDINKNIIELKKLFIKLLGGTFDSSMNIGLNTLNPTYKGKMDLKELQIANTIDSLMPSLKGAASGNISCSAAIASSGFMMSDIQKRLIGNGNFSFKKFVYSAASLNGMIKPHTDKVSFLKDKLKLKNNVGWDTITGTLTIANEKINAEQILAEDGLYTVKGKGVLGFDQYIDMYLDFYLPYSDAPYEPIKLKNEDRVMLPLHAIGPMLKPRLDFPLTMKYITQKTIDNQKEKLMGSVKPKVNQEVKKKTEEVKKQIEQKAGKDVKKLLKKFKF